MSFMTISKADRTLCGDRSGDTQGTKERNWTEIGEDPCDWRMNKVVKTIINHPCFDCLYHPFMVILGGGLFLF